jgi:GT2 family glycosyltransferase
MSNIIEIDMSQIKASEYEKSIYKVREQVAQYVMKKHKSMVTILVQAYNGLTKTKRCVESLIESIGDIDCELWLIDNGSTDGTLEYFKTVEFEKMNIIHLNENKGSPLPWHYFSPSMLSKYIAIVASDIIFTKNWLSNLIKIAESDLKIGMVNPMSSNVSNLQQVDLAFNNYDEMKIEAAKFNVSDSRKWNERLRLVTLGTLFKKECLYAIGLPLSDIGFAHNFGDDDITFRVRRAGYKAILAGDTWIHHDDDKSKLSPEKLQKMNEDLAIGRQNFRDKYFGIDAWDDVNNFIPEYLSALKVTSKTERARVLGIDVRCGTPILEIKNALRKFDIFDTECSAHTVDAKYTIDLQTVCGASNVFSGSINGFSESFEQNAFDYIVIGNDINTYSDPFRILKSAYKLLRTNGQLFFSLHNTNNIFNFAYSIGLTSMRDTSHAIDYTVEEILEQLMQQGYNVKFIAARGFEVGVVSQELLSNVNLCFDRLPINDRSETMYRLTSEHYYLVIDRNEN